MKSIEILALGIRLVGIYATIQIIQFSIQTIAFLQKVASTESATTGMYLTYGSIISLLFIVCFLLVKFPVTIAKKLISQTSESEVIFNGSSTDLQISAFIIMGVFILSSAIPGFINVLSYIGAAVIQPDLYTASTIPQLMLKAISPLAQICIGLYLTFKANALNLLIQSIRSFGAK